MIGKSWDKLLLLLAGLTVIGVSAYFSLQARSFGGTFHLDEASPNNELPETEEERARIAQSFVEKTQSWSNPVKGTPAKPLPLFVSVPIVEAGGRLIDLGLEDTPLRPPVTNAWLTTHNLDYLNSGVLQQDTDNDGFDNLTEWEAKTNPVDSASHPPYAEKLLFASRQQQLYTLRFAAKPDDERFQINRLPSQQWPRGENFYVRVGEISKDEQFRVEGFEERRAPNPSGIEVDASVVKITYLPKNEPWELVRNRNTEIPTYFADMKFALDPSFQQYVKEGDAFALPIDPGTKYRVVKVEEDSVEIVWQTGDAPEQTIQIPKK